MKQTDNFQFNLTSLAPKHPIAKYWWLRAMCSWLVCFGLMLPQAQAQSPGGVTTAFNLWLKANIGITATSGQVTTWADQVGTSITTQATATASADITLNASEANFNPTIKFTGTSGKELEGFASSDWSTAALTMFIVAKDEGTTENIAGLFATGAPGPGVVWVTGGTYQLDGNGCTSAATVGALGQYRIIRATYTTANNTNGGTMWVDGKQTGTGINCGTVGGNRFEVGGRINGSLPDRVFKGGIAEVLAAKQSFTTAELQRIESYLALKYGITLDQTAATDYLASDGTTKMWDAATGATFNNDIAGIGRDDGSALNQKQAKSASPDAIISMGLGTIATDNASNANAFGTDKTFFSWANDNAAADITNAATSGLPSTAMNVRMTRVWKVQEPQADVGNLSIQFNLKGLSYTIDAKEKAFLLISSSATDFSGATVVNATSFANGVATFDNVNLSNGQFITLGALVTAPGGVTANIALWVKANTGVTATGNNVSSWIDQTNNNSLTLNGDPQTGATAMNFNNVLDLDGEGDFFVGDREITFTEAFASVSHDGPKGRVLGGDLTLGGCGAYFFGSVAPKMFIGDGDFNSDYVSIPSVTGFNILNGELKGGANTDSRIAVNGLDGTVTNLPAANNGLTPFTARPVLGSCNLRVGDLKGNLGEIIVYSSGLSAADRQKVNSYLALKYGITLDQTTATDYLASDGTTKMWDGTVSVAYKNNIAGIGRDDASALNQTQSKSINSGSVVAMGLGIIAASSASNTNTFATDKMFLAWSDNGGSTDFANVTTTNLPGEVDALMARVWRVEENNGDVGNTQVKVDLSGLNFPGAAKENYVFLVSADGANFSSATKIRAASFASNVVTFDNINLADGQFFTVGYICTPMLAGTLSSAQIICSGNTPNQFTSVVDASGDGTITYQWQSSTDNATWADIAGATSKDYQAGALTAVTYFRRVATSSIAFCGSVNSEVIKVDITSQVAPSVAISANVADGIICEGTSVTFTAATTTGGTSPTYQWQVNNANVSGETNAAFTSTTLKNGDVVSVVMTSSLTCVSSATANSNTLAMVVNPTATPAVTITGDNTLCSGTTVTYTANPSAGGTNPAYQWKLNGVDIAGATSSTYTSNTLANGDKLSVMMTSSLTCLTDKTATSEELTLSVGTTTAAAVTVGSNLPNNTACGNGNLAIFTAFPSAGGSNPTFQWKVNSTDVTGETNRTFAIGTLSSGDKVTVAMTSSATCVTNKTATATEVTFNIATKEVPAVTVAASVTTITQGQSITFTATPVNGGATPAYQWQVNGTAVAGETNATFTTTSLADQNKVTVVMTSAATCLTTQLAISEAITVTVVPELVLNMPNLFTPNSDGNNDMFYVIMNAAPASVDFRILNVQNQTLYETKDVSNALTIGWDGRFNGKPQPNGRYVWFIKYKSLDGKEVRKKGFIILAR
ncbi:T9SS type B sorting domain-containing protein [Microscilla marina]|uniref:Ig-like domain-containing protein n=1 Tax=Microscilla marina ATCC 23134 TaxID=313606 RepID=A1ZQP1_MICM2|nr:gliding motility-associated C-terminal domain-containing protein [Microscilla marina]EAY27196.1 hypothetical protein M23134_06506 [Microscilla marina ATCC 23134]